VPIATRPQRPTLLVVGVVTLVAACSSPPVPSPSPVPSSEPSGSASTAAASPHPSASGASASPAPSAGVDDVWTLAGFGDVASSTQVRSVIDVDDGFVAVGSSGGAGEVAMAWHSTDGTTWEAETIAGRGTSPSSLVVWEERVLALGGGQSARCAHPGELDVWVRERDATWTEAPFDRLFCAGGIVTPVILRDRPWLIGDGSGDVPVAMDSDDGLTWADHRDRVGDVFLWNAAVDGTGLWVMARAVAGDDWLALHTRDGTEWTTRPLGAGAEALDNVLAATVVEDRLVVLVTTPRGIRRLSPTDAGGWDVRAVTGLPSPDLSSVIATGGGLVAIATHEDGTTDLWASSDGIAWRRVALPSEAGSGTTLLGAAIHQGRAVLVGQVETSGGVGAVGAVWTAPATILAP
jgi:hypothetical protein